MTRKYFYHGSPTKGIRILKPKKDPRLGIKGIFIADQPFGPMMFALLSNRAKSSVKYETKGKKFIKGRVETPFPLHKEGYLYIVQPQKEELQQRKPGRYHLIKSIQVLKCRKVSQKQVLRLGWKVRLKENSCKGHKKQDHQNL